MTGHLPNHVKTVMPDMYRILFKGYPDIMDVNQVGEILGVSKKTVYKLIRADAIVSLKVGREFRIPKVHLLSYVGMTGVQDCE